MKFISFYTDKGCSWGATDGTNVVDMRRRHPDLQSLKAAIGSPEWPALSAQRDLLDAPDRVLADLKLAPVIPDPDKVICIGLNYDEHRIESKREKAAHPTVFVRSPDSQVAHGGDVILPPESQMLDFEGELAVVIGAECRRVRPEDAEAVIAGYACYNDVSVRDYQRHTTQFHPGKNWPGTGAFGPWLVTRDEIPDLRALRIETRLNGETVQSGRLDQLIFGVPELIAYCSTWTVLRPGDVIVTGTPSGVGAARQPPLWMKHGDVVQVEVPGVGLLTNRVKREALAENTGARVRAPATL
jgi:2-keto-4-pentenoate hydratase/2-oxohepta-3-ene-1,7-dioic acid hydratase in catechol pathway